MAKSVSEGDAAAMGLDAVDYAATFHESPNAYLVVARDYRMVDMNEAYLRLVGRTRIELLGVDLFEAFPAEPDGANPDQAAELRASFDKVFSTGQANHLPQLRYSIPRPDGNGFVDTLWSTSHHPLTDGDGNVKLVLHHAMNVADLRATLLEAMEHPRNPDVEPADSTVADYRELVQAGVMRRAESLQMRNRSLESDRLRLLRLFDQSLSFTVFMRQPEHVVELANPAYLRMVGEEDLRDRRYGEAHRGGQPPLPIKLLDAVFESGIPIVEHGLALRVPDSDTGGLQTIYVDVVIQRIVDGAGKVIGVFMQGNDVTMMKATQDELHAYRTRLEEMVAERTRALERSESERRNAEAALHRAQRLEAVGKLTGGVAHDFNNVLQIIRGNLQLLQRSTGVDGRIGARIEAALDGVDRGAKLSSQLLAFGRRQPLEPIVVNLEQLLRRMDDLLRRSLGESIDVRTHVADGLWNTLVDVTRLENVILNIAINARDAMRHSGNLTMELANTTVRPTDTKPYEGLAPGDYVTLSISDTGAGMDADVQRRAFEPFFTTKPEGEGTGLGLSMVYGFIKQSGGHVSLYSEVGQGTTIRLYLPRSNDPVMAVAPQPEVSAARGHGESILVVEDDEAVRVTVVDTLTDLGYRVLRASDGQSALAIVRSGVPIDLLFTDVIMPGPVASTEMVKQARALLPQVKVLFTSGFTRDAIVHRDRLQAGVNLLSKPYGRDELASRLRQLLAEEGGGDSPVGEPASPTMPMDEPALPVREEAITVDSPPPPAGRVLLVEDSEEVRETTVEFIMEVGFAVEAVGTAEAALVALEKDRYDIVFTDISLPGISGLQLMKRAREADPSQRFVIASGYATDLGGQRMGPGVGVLAKPYDLATLERVLAEVMAAKT